MMKALLMISKAVISIAIMGDTIDTTLYLREAAIGSFHYYYYHQIDRHGITKIVLEVAIKHYSIKVRETRRCGPFRDKQKSEGVDGQSRDKHNGLHIYSVNIFR